MNKIPKNWITLESYLRVLSGLMRKYSDNKFCDTFDTCNFHLFDILRFIVSCIFYLPMFVYINIRIVKCIIISTYKELFKRRSLNDTNSNIKRKRSTNRNT